MRLRAFAVGCLLASVTAGSARGEGPAEETLREMSQRLASAYTAGRSALAAAGKRAQTAADAGDLDAWRPANAEYLEVAEGLQAACERAVKDLASKPTDLGDRGVKTVFEALTPHLKAAGPLLESRLLLTAYTELLGRTPPAQRAAGLAAFVPLYFTGT